MIKNPLFIKIGISLALISLVIFVLIFVSFDINKKVSRISDLKESLNARSQLVKNLSILRSDYNQIQSVIGDVKNLLISKDQLINFSSDLNALASQTKTSSHFSFVGENSKIDELSWVGLNMTIGGGFDNLIQFFKLFENEKYFAQFDNLDMTGEPDNFNITMNGRIFYSPSTNL